MFIILGATGHVGSAAIGALLDAGEPVLGVTHSEEKAESLRRRGAEAAVVDVLDTEALRAVFRRGRRAFLHKPPADPAGDIDLQEARTARRIVAALDGSGLEKVVAASTYGTQPGERCGDLTSLYIFEQALAAQPIPVTVNRGAYYMSNWDEMADATRQGSLPTMLPADLFVPMVAPEDLGRAAARRLREPVAATGTHYVEGPDRYTPRQVAGAFARALGQPVEVAETPRDQWEATYRKLGFSNEAAASYCRMTAATVDGPELPANPDRGTVTLDNYVAGLVRRP